MEFITIPDSNFWMGAQKDNCRGNFSIRQYQRGNLWIESKRNFDIDAWNDESPIHQVEISSYRISKYPVTVGQYQQFMKEGGYENKHFWEAGGFGKYKKPDKWENQKLNPSHPVVYVSWYEAVAFTAWTGGRLPTEAEWERAARGPDQEYRKYPWSNNNDVREIIIANFLMGKIMPVGSLPAGCSPEGVSDMSGNVWEWCHDWYSREYYQHCAQQGMMKNPRGPEMVEINDESGRVVRGDSFDEGPRLGLRCAARSKCDPLVQCYLCGFRVVHGPSG